MARSLKIEIVGDASSLEKALGQAKSSSQTFGRSLGRAAMVGGAAFAAIGVSAVKAAGEYETSLNTFQAVSGATAGQMAKVSDAAKQLGRDTKLPGTSAKDAAEAMTELAKGGLKVSESMKAARGVLQLSAAAQIGNAEAATITARALNAFGMAGKKATKVADLLAATSNASTAEITDVAAAMQQASASAHQLGVPIEDLTTSIGLMANAGIAGSDAGTSLKTMMSRLSPQTKKAAEAMAELGLATKEGKSRFFDAEGQFIGMRASVDLLSKATAGLSQEQRQQAFNTIFGSDSIRAANIVLAAGTSQWDKMHAATTRGGEASALAAAKMKGFKGAMESFKSTVETLQIELGQKLLPAATGAMKALTDLVDVGSKHTTTVRIAAGAVAGLTAAILIATNTAKVASTVMTLYAAATGTAITAQTGLNIAMRANVIGLVVTALAALATGLIIAWQRSETFRTVVTSAFETTKAVVSSVISGILFLIDKWLAGFELIARAGSKLPLVGDKFKGVAEAVSGARDKVQSLQASIDSLKSKEITVTTTFRNLTINEASAVPKIPGRARGGPVKKGMAYIVGEKQPELFVPGLSGKILPSLSGGFGSAISALSAGPMSSAPANARSNRGGDVYVTVNGFVGNDQDIALRIRDALVRYSRSNGSIFGGAA